MSSVTKKIFTQSFSKDFYIITQACVIFVFKTLSIPPCLGDVWRHSPGYFMFHNFYFSPISNSLSPPSLTWDWPIHADFSIISASPLTDQFSSREILDTILKMTRHHASSFSHFLRHLLHTVLWDSLYDALGQLRDAWMKMKDTRRVCFAVLVSPSAIVIWCYKSPCRAHLWPTTNQNSGSIFYSSILLFRGVYQFDFVKARLER